MEGQPRWVHADGGGRNHLLERVVREVELLERRAGAQAGGERPQRVVRRVQPRERREAQVVGQRL